MRRTIAVMACLSIVMFSSASVALARGPHHGGPGRGYGHHYQGQRWNNNFRGPIYGSGYGPAYCAPRPYAVGYPVYPGYPVAPVYPRLGFGLGGNNFSLWYQQ